MFDQAVALLSQYPGSLVYHFGILFAIEAALAIALGYRQLPNTRRVVLAAGGMLIGRLALVVVALLDLQGIITDPVVLVPPLERAVDAIGIWLLIWALLPLFDDRPQWGDLLAGGLSLLLLVLYLFFAVAWYQEASQASGLVSYNTGLQETVWEVIQLGLMGAALVYLLLDRRGDWTLVSGILLLMLLAHAIHFGWAAEGENVAGWERLGQLVAYPLFTAAVYRRVLDGLIQKTTRPPSRSSGELLALTRRLGALTGDLDEDKLVRAAVGVVAEVTHAETVAILGLVEAERVDAKLVALYHDGQVAPPVHKIFDLDDAPALRRAINFKQTLFLRPGGTDNQSRLALLVHLLPQSPLQLRLNSSLLIQPIYQEQNLFGLILVQPAAGEEDWPSDNRQLVELLATQLSTLLSQVRTRARLQNQAGQLGKQLDEMNAEAMKKLGQLESELGQARRAERDLARQLDLSQRELVRSQKHAQELALLLEEQASSLEQEDEPTDAGEEELDSIALIKRQMVELTAGLASSSQETVGDGADATTIGDKPVDQVALELRQPVAAISGYTDLLLNESVGAVGEMQKLFLQRVKASAVRAWALLDELTQVAKCAMQPISLQRVSVDLPALVDETVQGFRRPLDEKSLALEVQLDNVPLLEMDRGKLQQILAQLLTNAVQVSPAGGAIVLEVNYQKDQRESADDETPETGYLFVSVRDSGCGVPLDEQAHVFDRHYWAEHPTIAGLGAMQDGLPLVQELVQAQCGRIWLDSEAGGSTFSLVLPVAIVQTQTAKLRP